MAGQVKRLVDELLQKRAGDNETLKSTTKTKLIMKGINADNYTEDSADDEETIRKIKETAQEWGIEL